MQGLYHLNFLKSSHTCRCCTLFNFWRRWELWFSWCILYRKVFRETISYCSFGLIMNSVYNYRVCFCLLWGWERCSRCHPWDWQHAIWVWKALSISGMGKSNVSVFIFPKIWEMQSVRHFLPRKEVRSLDNWHLINYDDFDWQGERGRHRDGPKSGGNQRPTKTLFVINFDPTCTRTRDIERHFEPYGNVLHVRIRRNFAFVQFENQEDATRALECTHMRLVGYFILFLMVAISYLFVSW